MLWRRQQRQRPSSPNGQVSRKAGGQWWGGWQGGQALVVQNGQRV